MSALHDVILEVHGSYLSIIKKTINETNSTFDPSCLEPEVIDIANHRLLTENNIARSLFALSVFLKEDYGKHCIVFIDEYDDPYDTVYHNGYYEKARPIMSQLLLSLLKVLILPHTYYSIFISIL
jgi:hypothetical protein